MGSGLMEPVVDGVSENRVSRWTGRLLRRPRSPLLSLLLALTLLLLGLVSQPAHISSAEDAPAQDWEQTGLTEPVSSLMTPTTGAFFAQTPRGLLRSDDAGVTWAPVNAPDGVKDIVVDPTDHTVLYGISANGVYKSIDDAAT
jgi:hypothetical protein